MFLEALTFGILALSVLVLYTLVSHFFEGGSLPPGPIPLPIIGNMLDMGPKPHLGLTEVAKRFGNVFRLTVGIHRIVVVNSIDVAREALVKKANDFAGRPKLFTSNLISRGGKDIAFSDFGPTWRLQRKIAHSALKMFGNGIVPLEEKVCEETNELIGRFEAMAGKAFDPHHDIILTVINIICAFVFGSRYDLENPEFHAILDYNEQFRLSFRAGNLVDYFPWLRFFPNKGLELTKEAIRKRDVILQAKLDEHKQTFEDGITRDLTDALLKAIKDCRAEGPGASFPLNEDHVIMTMFDIFSAGLETTSTCIEWSLVYFSVNPAVQERIHRELDAVVGPDRLPTLQDRRKLPYLEAAIAEVLRYSSMVPLLFPHATTADTTLSGYDIPKDTIVLFNVWAMHHDPSEWSNPYEFDPTRFLDADGNFVCPATKSYMPFSAGRRVCLAETLGKLQLFLFISRLLHKFSFSVPSDRETPDLEGVFGASLCPKPYRLLIERRL